MPLPPVKLVKSGMLNQLTGYCEADTRTAIARGLAEYVSRVKITMPGARELGFKRVFHTWASPEDQSTYPSAYVNMGSAAYDGSRFTPSPSERCKLPDGRWAVTAAEMTADVTVEIYCNDPVERMGLVLACEAAFITSTDMYGIILELPFYYNARAVYSLQAVQYIDDDTTALRRDRRAVLTLQAQLPVIIPFTLPEAKAVVRIDAVGPDVYLDPEATLVAT